MNLVEYKGAYFDDNTPDIVRDVILDCATNKTLVHILTGDPLTGVITPNIYSVGYVKLSGGSKPMPIFESRLHYSTNGVISVAESADDVHTSWLKTDRILKVVDVADGKLLFQSYECHASPLKIVNEIKVSPYGDVAEKSKIICANPEIELFIDKSVDAVELCQFLFGQIHLTRDMRKCLEDHLKSVETQA